MGADYAEIGDFNRFDSPDKILAYAGFSPNNISIRLIWMVPTHIWKNVAPDTYDTPCTMPPSMSAWDPTFTPILLKRAEGKHYNVAISHAVKTGSVIYHLEKKQRIHKKAALNLSNSASF